MKLLRVGQKGQEKPAALDKNGKIRDLSDHIKDLNPSSTSQSSFFDPETISISSLGPHIELVAFINIMGSLGISAPTSAAWSE